MSEFKREEFLCDIQEYPMCRGCGQTVDHLASLELEICEACAAEFFTKCANCGEYHADDLCPDCKPMPLMDAGELDEEMTTI